MTIHDSYRGTGRTTRMLEEAIKSSADRLVIVVVPNSHMIDHMFSLIRQILGDKVTFVVSRRECKISSMPHSIRFVTLEDIRLQRLCGYVDIDLKYDHDTMRYMTAEDMFHRIRLLEMTERRRNGEKNGKR